MSFHPEQPLHRRRTRPSQYMIYRSRKYAGIVALAYLLVSSSTLSWSVTSFSCEQQRLILCRRLNSQRRRGMSNDVNKLNSLKDEATPLSYSRWNTHSSILSSSSSSSNEENGELKQSLKRYGFGSRIVTLTNTDLAENGALPAEMYEGKNLKLCLIVGLKAPSFSSPSWDENNEKPPLLEVLVMDDDGLLQEKKIVDIGQITTVWDDFHDSLLSSTETGSSIDDLIHTLQSTFQEAQQSLQNNILPIEKTMQALYNSRLANRSRPPSNHRYALTKKQIPKLANRFSNPPRLEELLRNLLKVGEDRISRMVDSALTTDYLYSDFCRDGDNEKIIRRIVSAQVLTKDAVSGGRFKRRSCQFVTVEYNGKDNSEEMAVQEVTLVNGGWISVDPSVKAGAEGRKFASLGDETKGSSKTTSGDTNDNDAPRIFTAADERIAHRLECLAMGDEWRNGSNEEDDQRMLELDVREALANMNLPLTPQGATSALIQIGRWSEDANNGSANKRTKSLIEPWPPEVLDSARSLARYENGRRELLASESSLSRNKGLSKSTKSKSDYLEGRLDLSSLPCVCIDAKRASFRDDSIGIRLRSSTGRKVNKDASKWEVLIHIADVSDLYFDKEKSNKNVIIPREKDLDFNLLRQSAERRGQSRYDLPLGPLHLLPPVALTALALVTDEKETVNRCVTLWAYIDERDGKLLEAGLERTIVSSPTALSFVDATIVLESSKDNVPKSMSTTKALLSVAERNLSLWSQRHQQLNQAAQKREKRLATKEAISKELTAAARAPMRDDGVGGSFQRSQGHRVVDSALDLYAFAISTLMNRAKHPIPRAAGSGADRGGRLGTAPLRRYIDGIAQRQALSVLCNYGLPLSLEECREATKIAARSSDTIANLSSTKDGKTTSSSMTRGRGGGNQRGQVSALHSLARHLSSTGGIQNMRQVKAMSTGRNNEVVIIGAGATARCRGVKGTLKSGEKLLVQVVNIDPEKGVLDVKLV